MGALKTIGIGVLIFILGSLIVIVINIELNDRADVGFQLSAADSVGSNETLQVDLNLENKGNIETVPTCNISVINATIQRVSIPNVAGFELSEYCFFNDTVAMFQVHFCETLQAAMLLH